MSNTTTILTSETDSALDINYTDGHLQTVEHVVNYGITADEEGLLAIFINDQPDEPRLLVNMESVRSIEVKPYERKSPNKVSK